MNAISIRVDLGRIGAAGLALALFLMLALPLAALMLSASPAEMAAGTRHPLFAPALGLSLRTTAVSLVFIVVTGTPLAWWLCSSRTRWARLVELVVDLPIVLPPAVMGVALLQAYGRRGAFGGVLETWGISIPFTTAAVVMAQVVVAAPFYVQAAVNAFRGLDRDLLLVARTLGASPTRAILRVAIPVALPGLIGGAALAWARSLGEFGATLLFAGNFTGSTQTMPVAIYTALESDVRVALALSLVLAAIAVVFLFALRLGPNALTRWLRPGASATDTHEGSR
jgi:molybdate transport system permease protein